MKHMTIAERVAVLASLIAIIVGASVPFILEAETTGSHHAGMRLVTLTGVAELGYWTDEDVRASHYWNRSLRPARPVLEVGETVLFRLKSADVVHSFYSPGLGIGPVEVYPGKVSEVPVTPTEKGVFDYYCTTVCGERHFAMRGVLIVGDQGNRLVEPTVEDDNRYWLEPEPRSTQRVERGKWLFRRKGCETCHGTGGRGGVRNWNYLKEAVPPLNTLSQTMLLFSPEDVNVIVERIEQGVPLESLGDSPPVPRFDAVVAQYRSVRNVIRKGSSAGKKDPTGLPPPLEMPAWQDRLSDEDIDAIIAYLLTQQPWDDARR